MTWVVTRDDYRWEKLARVFNDCVKQYDSYFSSYKPYTLKEIDEYYRCDGTSSYTFKCENPCSGFSLEILTIRITDYLLAQYERLCVSFEQKDGFLFVAKEVNVGDKALLEI